MDDKASTGADISTLSPEAWQALLNGHASYVVDKDGRKVADLARIDPFMLRRVLTTYGDLHTLAWHACRINNNSTHHPTYDEHVIMSARFRTIGQRPSWADVQLKDKDACVGGVRFLDAAVDNNVFVGDLDLKSFVMEDARIYNTARYAFCTARTIFYRGMHHPAWPGDLVPDQGEFQSVLDAKRQVYRFLYDLIPHDWIKQQGDPNPTRAIRPAEVELKAAVKAERPAAVPHSPGKPRAFTAGLDACEGRGFCTQV